MGVMANLSSNLMPSRRGAALPPKQAELHGSVGRTQGEEAVPQTPSETREREIIVSSTPKQNGDVNHTEETQYTVTPIIKMEVPNKKSISDSVDLSYIHKNNNIDEKSKLIHDTSDTGQDRKKKHNTDKAYFIAKELLSTERTYRKDVEVINFWFRDEISKEGEEMPGDVLNVLFALIHPLNEFHNSFLRDIEQRLSLWEGRSNAHVKDDYQRIGDIIRHNFSVLPLYDQYIDKHLIVLEALDSAFRRNKKFEQLYRDFELQKVCYLPLSSFILKPLQRILHYKNLLQRLIEYHGPDHPDYQDCLTAQAMLSKTVQNVPQALIISQNFIQLSELQRDMPSFEGLIQVGREFIRQGCLLKHSRKGYQQRMFFLFSDILVYTNRTTTPNLQFKVHGQMPLRGVMVEDVEEKMGANYCFIIYGGNRALTVAASSQEEKDKWMEDIADAVNNAREKSDGKMLHYLSLKSCSSSDEIIDKISEDANGNREKSCQQRSNTTVHVCWHRNTSTSLRDQIRAFENELSGFLLRKFKNSNGWQKLWVVFTNFCLFFYKSFQDDAPLASLPLLGYTVTLPGDQDGINKDFVFKLQFKNHVYFFRAESEYTFARWMEVIRSATSNAGRIRLFSRKDSSLNQTS